MTALRVTPALHWGWFSLLALVFIFIRYFRSPPRGKGAEALIAKWTAQSVAFAGAVILIYAAATGRFQEMSGEAHIAIVAAAIGGIAYGLHWLFTDKTDE
jgi:hypothetical protein